MYYLLVTLNIKTESVEEFIPSQIEMAQKVLSEPGCLRYDFMKDNENPNKFYRCEIYKDEEAFEAHGALQHTSDFRELTKDWWLPERLSAIKTTDIFISEKGS